MSHSTSTAVPAGVLRQHAEQQFANELATLARADDRPRPPNWKLSPWAVATYLLGGKAGGVEITAKYVGKRRLVEIAIATLATDRALLLLGVPGTAKTWVAEHLAAAISGDSTRVVQGTAGTAEEQVRYGWNYALLLAKGPSSRSAGSQPDHEIDGRRDHRPHRGTDPHARRRAGYAHHHPVRKDAAHSGAGPGSAGPKGFNVIATANNRDKGVNELSSALKRRFNTVILPVPDNADEEVRIVRAAC